MADDKTMAVPGGGDDHELTAREQFELLTDEQKAELLGGETLGEISEADLLSRLSHLDSGDVLDEEDVKAGLHNELQAQLRVIDQLSDQREEASLNIAKVLDSAAVNLDFLMREQVKDPTRTIIGPDASAESRASIREKISLPTKTALKMCWKSVLIRLGRVAITASGIFLGIAFFSSVRMTAISLQAAGEVAGQEDAARNVWLIVMALMVSVVGICNSMLMAVTERFQEIGTMKCLGALDSFIVKLFLIESAILGGLAGVFGSLIGMGLMLIVNKMKYTFALSAVLPGMAETALISFLLGVILSVMAAILPARQAARMPAAAALRTTV
ncbi:MAG: FtsX-like permease family protein [Fimbriimonadaceae bacterium]|nr:FtsX-like permease family protein [Fimbriimonadaceae bacterium]